MLIAIDASTRSTGFAFGGPGDGCPRGGVWPLPGCDEHTFDMTLARITESVGELCRMVRAEHLMIEAPLLLVDQQHAAATAMALIQLTGAIRAAAKRQGCKVRLAAVQTVRKHFIGTAHLKRAEAKAATIARCKQLGWPVADGEGRDSDDRADANAVWAYGMALLYPKWAPQTSPLFAKEGGAA
jgi:Holliday junction resolvasome RuvABC endonuclease subunit